MTRRAALLVCAGVLSAACGGRDDRPALRVASACADSAVADVARTFGERLRSVSLLAPDTIVRASLRSAYGDLATPELLERWLADPARAPGTKVSSPWPEAFQIDSIAPDEGPDCRVYGRVLYATSTGPAEGGGERERWTLTVRRDDRWRLSAVDRSSGPADAAAGTAPDSSDTPDADSLGAGAAVRVVRSYYDAISRRDYRAAYALWSDGGRASGKSYDAFAEGFAATDSARVDPGPAGPIEGAAGSRYVEVPVVVRAWTRRGEAQRFEGTYVLRRAVVDGATAEQRAWRIYSGRLEPVR